MTIDDENSYLINDIFLSYLEKNLPNNAVPNFISINQDLRTVEYKRKVKIITDELNASNDYIAFIKSIDSFIEIGDVVYLSFLSPRLFRAEYVDNLNFFRAYLYKLLIYFGLYNNANTGNSLIRNPEIIGFLYFMGFEVIDEFDKNDLHILKTRKVDIKQNVLKPNLGLYIKLRRVGKNGKMIDVYKLRTMYKYSEFSQEYYIKKNKLNKIGKIKSDPRVSKFGYILRKYWIDELPQLLQLFSGKLRLVGLRPIGKVFLKQYPPDLRDKRQKYKPAVLPISAIQRISNVKQIFEMERKYIAEKESKPIITDLKYLFLIILSIISGNRSM